MGKYQTSLVIGKRVLLPVDEMIRRLYAKAVRQNSAAAVRCWTQAYNLGAQLNRPIVFVMCNVMQCDVNRHKCK